VSGVAPGDSAPSSGNGREALLIDWGGVLTTNLFVSFHTYCTDAGVDFEALGRRFRGDKEFRTMLIALETGELSESDFEPRLAAMLGVPSDGLIDGLLAGVQPDEAMIAAVRRARDAGVRTALVSNSWGVHRYPHDLFEELFDGIVISGEVGMRKPAPAMYELGAERAGVAAERCVFVDDLVHNLPPAQELGMATVHHTDASITVPELERLLNVSLTGDE
jgi:epoxide hydrolase-like predicted phosphatase